MKVYARGCELTCKERQSDAPKGAMLQSEADVNTGENFLLRYRQRAIRRIGSRPSPYYGEG